MCTLTFIPLTDHGFVLTSSRDESALRPGALPPQTYRVHGKNIVFPKDTKASGTWIATDNERFTLCLLNGAFEKHQPRHPYRLSRGLMVLDFFNFNEPAHFIDQYNFSGIEPFTLIIIDTKHELRLHELRWDGHELHWQMRKPDQPHIWSSVTLYTSEIVKLREQWFKAWLDERMAEQAGEMSAEDVLEFHRTGGSGDPAQALLMSRHDHRTVSITSIRKHQQDFQMVYKERHELEAVAGYAFVNHRV